MVQCDNRSFYVYYPDGTEGEHCGDDVLGILNVVASAPLEYWTDSLSIATESSWIHIFQSMPFGWLVVCCGQGDPIEYFLCWNDKETAEIRIRKGVNVESYRRGLFVDTPTMTLAVVTYIREDRRASDLNWLPVGDLFNRRT